MGLSFEDDKTQEDLVTAPSTPFWGDRESEHDEIAFVDWQRNYVVRIIDDKILDLQRIRSKSSHDIHGIQEKIKLPTLDGNISQNLIASTAELYVDFLSRQRACLHRMTPNNLLHRDNIKKWFTVAAGADTFVTASYLNNLESILLSRNSKREDADNLNFQIQLSPSVKRGLGDLCRIAFSVSIEKDPQLNENLSNQFLVGTAAVIAMQTGNNPDSIKQSPLVDVYNKLSNEDQEILSLFLWQFAGSIKVIDTYLGVSPDMLKNISASGAQSTLYLENQDYLYEP